MSNKEQSTAQPGGRLLAAEEQDVCQKIAALDAGLASQRAATLLVVDEGLTRAQASERTGLTLGQIRYLMTRFRQKRLAMFPDDVLNEAQPPAEETSAEVVGAVEVETEAEFETVEQAAKKKARKSRAVKAGKKAKRTKAKAKKGKKAKKARKAPKTKAVKADKKAKKVKPKAKEEKKAKKSKKGKAQVAKKKSKK
jgi:hypothetical protein